MGGVSEAEAAFSRSHACQVQFPISLDHLRGSNHPMRRLDVAVRIRDDRRGGLLLLLLLQRRALLLLFGLLFGWGHDWT